MASEHFKGEYFRIARLADPELVDSLEWEKTDGALLERIVSNARAVVSELGALQLVEKQTSSRDRVLILSSTGKAQSPIAELHFRVAGGEARIWIQNAPESRFRISAPGRPAVAEGANATQEWLEAGIADLFASLNRPDA